MFRFEKVTVNLLFLLIVFPFNHMILISLFGFNITYQMLIYITMMFSILIFSFKVKLKKIESTIAIVFFVYLLFHVAYADDHLQALKHISIYSSFILALIYISIPINLDPKKIINYLVMGLTASLAIAISIHFFFPDIMISIKSKDSYITEQSMNRLYWGGTLTALFAIVMIFLYKIKRKEFLLLFFSIGIILTQNRTTYIAFALILVLMALYRKEIKISFNNLGVIMLMIIGVILTLLMNDNAISDTFKERLLSKDAFDVAFVDSRYILYDLYFQKLSDNFNIILGNGLGKHVAIIGDYYAAYYTDISALTFLLPIGLLGLLFLMAFIWRLYLLSSKIKDKRIKYYLSIFISIMILISFNIDVFARNEIIVIISILLSSYLYDKKSRTKL